MQPLLRPSSHLRSPFHQSQAKQNLVLKRKCKFPFTGTQPAAASGWQEGLGGGQAGGEAGQAVLPIYRRLKLGVPPPAPCLSRTCNADAGLGGGRRRTHHGPASSGWRAISWLLGRGHFQREKTEAQRYREDSPPQAAPLFSSFFNQLEESHIPSNPRCIEQSGTEKKWSLSQRDTAQRVWARG